jgi:D-methionine transport system ATP-binding protein
MTASATRSVITVRDLRFGYPGSSQDVLRVPFLDVPADGMIAVTGPSGAGKSTLIELLAGTLREPYLGSIQVLGTEWNTLTRDADRQRQLRRIGLIPQDYGLLTSRTPAGLLDQDLTDAGVPRSQRRHRIGAALAEVGLAALADRRISGLSGGQRQRVAIARMLARRVECVIADEPTANLDPVLTADAMRLFRTLAGRVPVIIVTHDPDVAGACDRVIVLQSAVDPRAPGQPAARPARSRRALIALGVCGAAAAVTAGALYLSSTTSPAPRHASPAASKTVHHLPQASRSPSASSPVTGVQALSRLPVAAERRFTRAGRAAG